MGSLNPNIFTNSGGAKRGCWCGFVAFHKSFLVAVKHRKVITEWIKNPVWKQGFKPVQATCSHKAFRSLSYSFGIDWKGVVMLIIVVFHNSFLWLNMESEVKYDVNIKICRIFSNHVRSHFLRSLQTNNFITWPGPVIVPTTWQHDPGVHLAPNYSFRTASFTMPLRSVVLIRKLIF